MATKRSDPPPARFNLPQDLMEMCREHGETVCRGYAGGDHPESRALSIRGAEKDPVLQAEGKMGECIFAIERGLDPLAALNWSGTAELDGVDITVNGVRVDVKQTRPGGRLLIWSAGKAGKLDGKKMDVFVLVICQMSSAGGHCAGWITKRDFVAKHRKAPPPSNLTPGTMFVDGAMLRPMPEFPASRDDLIARPENVSGSTWDAFTWLRKHQPQNLAAWLARHPEIPR